MSLDVCRAEHIRYLIKDRADICDADDAVDIVNGAMQTATLDKEAEDEGTDDLPACSSFNGTTVRPHNLYSLSAGAVTSSPSSFRLSVLSPTCESPSSASLPTSAAIKSAIAQPEVLNSTIRPLVARRRNTKPDTDDSLVEVIKVMIVQNQQCGDEGR